MKTKMKKSMVKSNQAPLGFIQLAVTGFIAISVFQYLGLFINPKTGMGIIFAVVVFITLTAYSAMSRITGYWMNGVHHMQKREKEFKTFPKAVFFIFIASLFTYFICTYFVK
jgi:hypothetical protein